MGSAQSAACTGSSQTGIGTVAWTNPTSANSANGVGATASLGNTVQSRWLQGIGFGFAIPSTAVIVGIEVEANCRNSTAATSCLDNAVRIVKGGVIGATDKAIAGGWSTGAYAYRMHGSPTDLWGETWTPADINDATFGCALSAKGSSASSSTANVDNYRITVYYTETISPTGIGSAEAEGSPTLTAGAVTVSATAIASGAALGAPTLTPGAVTVTPAGMATTAATGTPTLTSTATVSPSGIPTAAAAGAPTLTPGAVSITPAGTPPASGVGDPVLTPGAVTITPAGIPTTGGVGAPTATPGAATVTPAGMGSAEAVGVPTLTGGPVTVTASGIAGVAGVGAPILVQGGSGIIPDGVAAGGGIGAPVLTPGAASITPTGIASAAAAGDPTLAGAYTITITGIGPASGVGAVVAAAGAVTIIPEGIAGTAAAGLVTLRSRIQPVRVVAGVVSMAAPRAAGAVTNTPGGSGVALTPRTVAGVTLSPVVEGRATV